MLQQRSMGRHRRLAQIPELGPFQFGRGKTITLRVGVKCKLEPIATLGTSLAIPKGNLAGSKIRKESRSVKAESELDDVFMRDVTSPRCFPSPSSRRKSLSVHVDPISVSTYIVLGGEDRPSTIAAGTVPPTDGWASKKKQGKCNHYSS